MQPIEQDLRVTAPLSLLEQATTTRSTSGTSEIKWFGQVLVQTPQPMQLRVLMCAMPFSMQIASCGQAAAQSPKPMQP
jgi:hypothetical protein